MEDLLVHEQLTHKSINVQLNTLPIKNIKCGFCDFKCKYNIELKRHKEKKHSAQPKYNCDHCDFTTNYLGNAWEHSLNIHPNLPTNYTPEENENIALRIVAEQTSHLTNEIDDPVPYVAFSQLMCSSSHLSVN